MIVSYKVLKILHYLCFRSRESIGDIPTELLCLGNLENPDQTQVKESVINEQLTLKFHKPCPIYTDPVVVTKPLSKLLKHKLVVSAGKQSKFKCSF